jgi:hypothetical protein
MLPRIRRGVEIAFFRKEDFEVIRPSIDVLDMVRVIENTMRLIVLLWVDTKTQKHSEQLECHSIAESLPSLYEDATYMLVERSVNVFRHQSQSIRCLF